MDGEEANHVPVMQSQTVAAPASTIVAVGEERTPVGWRVILFSGATVLKAIMLGISEYYKFMYDTANISSCLISVSLLVSVHSTPKFVFFGQLKNLWYVTIWLISYSDRQKISNCLLSVCIFYLSICSSH